jgi:CHASE2 domain-containing sensor protein
MVHPINNLDGNNLQLNGKIVVIGDKVDQDMQPFPGGEKPGVWLHANYIQSLLDHRFLREVPFSITLVSLLLFIFVVYCLFWYIEQPERALLLGLAVVIVLIVISLGILVATSYFTPLWALWGAGLLVIFRYLETQAHHLSAHLKHQRTDPAE